MKVNYVLFVTLLSCFSAFSQEKGAISIRLRAGSNAVYVKDLDARPSGTKFEADGVTSKANEANSFVTVGANYDFGTKEIKFSPGIWFTGGNISLYNRDGGWAGSSKFSMSYLQIPLLIKYTSEKEIVDNLTWYVSGGPMVGLKLSEGLIGPDYSHYWNMAKYRVDIDKTRGVNGNGKPVALFNPLYASFMINGGVEYKLDKNFNLFGGLTFDFGMSNVLNPNLTYANPERTKITEYLKVHHNFIGIDLGVRF